MGFQPSKMEPDVRMHRTDNDGAPHYEHIVVYVDALLIASNSPKDITYLLTNAHKFNLKRTV